MSNPVRKYHENGNLEYEFWWENGKRHRIGAPAMIWYHDNGNIECEAWWENDKCHRIGAPAWQKWDKEGNLLGEFWDIDGVQLTDQQVTVIKRKLKFQIINESN